MLDCKQCEYLKGLASSQSEKLNKLREELHRKNLMLAALSDEYDEHVHGRPEDEPNNSGCLPEGS